MTCRTAFLAILFSSHAALTFGDTFGTGINTFEIQFVLIGNPGNPADTTGSPNPTGSVAYAYRMGKYEISEQMIDKANALGGLDVVRDGRGPDKPATGMNWNHAARFINWLNTSVGSVPAYKFAVQPGESGYAAGADIQVWSPTDAGYNPNNLYRNSLARYFLPSLDEWYKAAFYDPVAAVYYDYATGSNTAPTPVANGTAAGTAVYAQRPGGPADITLVGGLRPFGTAGQSGNISEWEETDYDLVNGPGVTGQRSGRGGDWSTSFTSLISSSSRGDGFNRMSLGDSKGFRVASTAIFPVGDFNRDAVVDAADYVVWRRTNGTAAQYIDWRSHFGQSATGSGVAGPASIPEPSAFAFVLCALSIIATRRSQSLALNRV